MRRRLVFALTGLVLLSLLTPLPAPRYAYPAAPAVSPGAELLGQFDWSAAVGRAAPRLGGLSGMLLSADGATLLAVSDRDWIFRARLSRAAPSGPVTAVDLIDSAPLRNRQGRALQELRADAEAMSRAPEPDSPIFVAFERAERVMVYDQFGGPGRHLPRADAFRTMPNNGSLESLAMDGAGRLYTLPEVSSARHAPFPVFRLSPGSKGGWDHILDIPRHDPFRPVSADIGPDGRFYLLERSFGLRGFASRLRRWTLIPDPPALRDPEVLLVTTPGQHDNLEAMTIWRAPDGKLRATFVSDDNFRSLQRTEIVEYSLPN